jgi:ribonuclease D
MADVSEHLVNTPEELAECTSYLAGCPQLGLDTEFVGEESYHPHLCLVQVATAERLFLIDPLSAGPLDAFWQLIVDPNRVTVVHAGREEVRLCQRATGHMPGNVFDTQIAAGLIGLVYPLGHAALVNQLLDVHLAKGETRTEWRHRPLTRQQVRYAFDDVRYLLPLWQTMSGELAALERTAWAREEFGRLTTNAAPEGEVVAERWRKLRGLGALDRRRLALARSLFHWREQMASKLNRPARVVLRDDLIVEIARRNPAKERDLHPVRGLARRDAPAIFQALEEARALPPEQWPAATERDLDPPQLGWLANLLTAVLGNFCTTNRLAGNLVASNQDIKLLVRARMHGTTPPADSLLTHGWRREHVLPELEAVLNGQRTVRVGDLRGETPLQVE